MHFLKDNLDVCSESLPDDKTISELEDIIDVFDLMDTYDIPAKELESFEELLDRIKMHVWSKKHGNYKQMVAIFFFIYHIFMCVWCIFSVSFFHSAFLSYWDTHLFIKFPKRHDAVYKV